MAGPRSKHRPAIATSALLLLAVLLWLAFPPLVWAHDCPGELEICLRKAAFAAGALLGAALAAVGGAMGRPADRSNDAQLPPNDAPPPPPQDQAPIYDPAGTFLL